jgi:hypothetical protein
MASKHRSLKISVATMQAVGTAPALWKGKSNTETATLSTQ